MENGKTGSTFRCFNAMQFLGALKDNIFKLLVFYLPVCSLAEDLYDIIAKSIVDITDCNTAGIIRQLPCRA